MTLCFLVKFLTFLCLKEPCNQPVSLGALDEKSDVRIR
jgi:hypothetical protein